MIPIHRAQITNSHKTPELSILVFMSMINFMLSRGDHGKSLYPLGLLWYVNMLLIFNKLPNFAKFVLKNA